MEGERADDLKVFTPISFVDGMYKWSVNVLAHRRKNVAREVISDPK